MKTVDHKCPSCNAPIKYNPKNKNWVCEYCGSKFTLDQLEANEKNYESTNVNNSKELKKAKEQDKSVKSNDAHEEEMDEYLCQDCGAKIVADKNTSATFCVYCKNTAILKSRLSDKFTPSKIIPFEKTKEDAIKAFISVGKGKFLMPKEFSDPKNIDELTGIYIPFWLYNCKMHGVYQGRGTRVTSWTTGDYIYTKTDTYNVEREGDYNYENIPMDGSLRFNDAIMNSIEPFNYDNLVDFNYSYLAGFLAEKYDVEKDEAKKVNSQRAEVTTYTDLESKARTGYSTLVPKSKTNNIIDESLEYALLPVWMVNIKYNDKMYTFAMNGETGKMIGDIPFSKTKLLIFILILFAVLFAITALVTYFV